MLLPIHPWLAHRPATLIFEDQSDRRELQAVRAAPEVSGNKAKLVRTRAQQAEQRLEAVVAA